MMFEYDTLADFYKMNWQMSLHHGYDIQTLEKMLPWERALYIDMTAAYVQKKNDEAAQAAQN